VSLVLQLHASKNCLPKTPIIGTERYELAAMACPVLHRAIIEREEGKQSLKTVGRDDQSVAQERALAIFSNVLAVFGVERC